VTIATLQMVKSIGSGEKMSKLKVIIRRIETFLKPGSDWNPQGRPQEVIRVRDHLNSFRNGTTKNQLNNALRKSQFKKTDDGRVTLELDKE